MVPLEEQGHQSVNGGRVTRLTEHFGAAEAAALGADACKLLLYYRADHPQTAEQQLQLLRDVADSCHGHGLPLVVEPLVYRLEGEEQVPYTRRFAELVASAARDTAAAGPDLLKLQFPGDAEACERVSEAAAPLNWALLGGRGTGGETFAEQLGTACRAGACGFMAGRAIWGGGVVLPEEEQRRWLRSEALPLFERLGEIAHKEARRIR
jgi:tagatose 1,6-diphosphate aldolase